MPQSILNCLDLFRRAWMILMLPLLHSVRRFVHIQSDHALDLCNICSMDFEAVLLLHRFLNTLITEFITLGVKHHMAGKVPKSKDFYKVSLCSNTIVSTCSVWGNISTG